MEVKLRDAKNDDFEELYGLVQQILIEFGYEAAVSTSEKDLTSIEKAYANGMFKVAENSSREIIGCIGVVKVDQSKCRLKRMYVSKTSRGRGIARLLLEAAIDYSRQSRYKLIELETISIMKSAISLYQKFGFKQQPKRKFNSPRCNIYMVKYLT